MPSCFNPYADRYEPFDLPDAPAIRMANLVHVLDAAAQSGVHDLWIGLELGHKGGRRTGLAMTDDVHISAHGARFGVGEHVRRATHAGPISEMTAGIVWQTLAGIERRVFLWNVVPWHPHQPGDPLTNRRHSHAERLIGLPLLEQLINLLRPERLVAVGKDASAALAGRGHDHTAVRHPAYGGKAEFIQQITCL